MRVTRSVIFDSAGRNTARAGEAAQQAQTTAATGDRIQQPADDPSSTT